MTETRVYFAVPDHYTIGNEHDTWADAVAAARAKIRPLELSDPVSYRSRAKILEGTFIGPSPTMARHVLVESDGEVLTIREDQVVAGGKWSRAFVDVRVADASGDRPLERFEIFREPAASPTCI